MSNDVENLSSPEKTKEANAEQHKSLFGSTLEQGERYELPPFVSDLDFDAFLFWGKTKNVSDFSFRSNDYIRGNVKGGWRRLTNRPITHDELSSVINTIDTATSTADLQKGHDIDRSYSPKEKNKPHRFRINITHVKSPINDDSGFNIIIRMLPGKPPTVKQLGIEKELVDNFYRKNSLSLITGGTGHGKSTLIYSLLQNFVEIGKNVDIGLHILDYSKPIEYTINDIESETFITQCEVGSMLKDFDNSTESAQWQYAVRNAVRRKPDIIVIGETRDKPTFDAVLGSANTGHYGLSTLHTNSAASSLQRALRFYSHEERLGVATDLIGFLHCIVNQELVSSACGKMKYALREFVIVNDYVRNTLLAEENVEKWPMLLHNMIMENSRKNPAERKLICQSKLSHAEQRFTDGEISQITLEDIRNRTRGMKTELVEIGPQQYRDE